MADESEVTNIRVAVRCRPLSKKELAAGEKSIFSLRSGNVCLQDPTDPEGERVTEFNFDRIFPPDCLQTELWDWLGQPLLDKCIEGFNGTVFAYGQTGSGKTFSMQGVAHDPDLRGLIPRFTIKLFERIKTEKENHQNKLFLVTCSYFEIYNEVLSDLLDPSSKKHAGGANKNSAGLEVKEHPVLGVYVKGLQEIVVEEANKMDQLIQQGMANRHVASTAMNEESSRSHSVFIIKVHQKDTDDESKSLFAKVNLVDLAGSERAKSTGATGATLKEGANINKSLSALGNVINALVESVKKKGVFIPYRNSKLTRVLQESLGGNSITAMLAALSPAAVNYEETLGTLKYASRAKSIKLSAKKNEEASQVSKLNEEITALKRKLEEQMLERGGAADGAERGEGAPSDPAVEERYKNQIKELEAAMHDTWEQKEKVSKEKEAQSRALMVEQEAAMRRIQDEREKRWQMLEEKDDVELSVRNVCDVVSDLPTEDWMQKVRQMLAMEQETREETTVTNVYRNAFCQDATLIALAGGGSEGSGLTRPVTPGGSQNSPGREAGGGPGLSGGGGIITSASIRQLLSKLHHLQTTGAKLLHAQGQLMGFCGEFVRELRVSSEKWEEAVPETDDGSGEGITMNEHLQKVRQAQAQQLKEDAARGLSLVVRQLNKKRTEIRSVVGDERAKLFTVAPIARELITAIEFEIDRTTNLGGIDDNKSEESELFFTDAETSDIVESLTKAKEGLLVFFASHNDSILGDAAAVGLIATPKKALSGATTPEVVQESDIQAAKPMGVSNGKILNRQMTASTNAESASSARLNYNSKQGGWTGTGEKGEYLEIDLKRPAIITAVSTQGLLLLKPVTPKEEVSPPTFTTRKVKKKVMKKVKKMVKKTVTKPNPAAAAAAAAASASSRGALTLGGVNITQINEDIVQTKDILAEVIDWPTLLKTTPPEKLLGRPPVRFLFDLISLLCSTTAFGAQQSWSQATWESLQSKSDKVNFMDDVIAYSVQRCGGESVGLTTALAKGGDIVTGSECAKTSKMLQVLGFAAAANTRGVAATDIMGGGGGGGGGGGEGSSSAAPAAVPVPATVTETIEVEVEVDEEVEVEVEEKVPVVVAAKKEADVSQAPQFTKKYRISISNDGKEFTDCGEEFSGTNSTSTSSLANPVACARFVRFIPTQWEGVFPTLRVEIVGLYRDERASIASPRLGDATNFAGASDLTSEEFATKIGELLKGLQSALSSFLKKAEKSEAAERLRAQRRRDHLQEDVSNLSNEKEALKADLKKSEEEKHLLEQQVAAFLEKLNEFQFNSVKLQAQSEKDGFHILHLQESLETAAQELREKDTIVANLNEEKEVTLTQFNDLAAQLNVVTEERDVAREKEEQLFQELSNTIEELDALQVSYVYMTERSNDSQDEIMELQEKVEHYQSMVSQMKEMNDLKAALGAKVAETAGNSSRTTPVPLPQSGAVAAAAKFSPLISPSASVPSLQSEEAQPQLSARVEKKKKKDKSSSSKSPRITDEDDEAARDRKLAESFLANHAPVNDYDAPSSDYNNNNKLPALGVAPVPMKKAAPLKLPTLNQNGRGNNHNVEQSDDNYDDDFEEDIDKTIMEHTVENPAPPRIRSARPQSASRGGRSGAGSGDGGSRGFTGH